MTDIARIAELLRRETGLVVPASRLAAIRTALDRAVPGLDPAGFLAAVAAPDARPGLVDRLIDEVTVQETAFVRDRGQLDAIGWHHLLAVARAAGSGVIRVWSAGCASGEEAYTLALLAAEAFAPAAPPVDVLGTDISGAALAAAAAGRYRERAVRGLDPVLRQRYLDQQADGSYLVGERLRHLVRFRRHNLARDPVPPAGEPAPTLVACRNVLIYFAATHADQVIGSLRQSLQPGGTLLLGAVDALPSAADTRPSAAVPAPPARPRARPAAPPAPSREQDLAAALAAADSGDRDVAVTRMAALLTRRPPDADAHFVDGLVALEAGEPARAAAALRRALCADPTFALAAFVLGGACDALGDTPAARRAYERALRTLDPADRRHERMLRQVDIGDIAAACRARLRRQP
jgi:chemotaxis protein methyltransferase CheR